MVVKKVLASVGSAFYNLYFVRLLILSKLISCAGLKFSEAIYFSKLNNNCFASGRCSISVVKSIPETSNLPLPALHSNNKPNGLAVNQSSITLTIG
jgi:hypothetical protein